MQSNVIIISVSFVLFIKIESRLIQHTVHVHDIKQACCIYHCVSFLQDGVQAGNKGYDMYYFP